MATRHEQEASPPKTDSSTFVEGAEFVQVHGLYCPHCRRALHATATVITRTRISLICTHCHGAVLEIGLAPL